MVMGIQMTREERGPSMRKRVFQRSDINPLHPKRCFMMLGSYPQTFKEACHDPRWQETMDEEFDSLHDNKTWKLDSLPLGRKLVQCRWVYKTKIASNGTKTKYKAQLVAKGYSQVQGLDYNETFTPVARMDSISLVLVVAASLIWEVHHMDVKSAFLHGDLKKEIYMKKPEGYIQDPSLF